MRTSESANPTPRDAPLVPLSSALALELGWLLLCALPLAAWILFRVAHFSRFVPNVYTLKSTWDFLDWHGYVHAWFRSRSALHAMLWLVPLALFVRETRRTALLGLAMVGAMLLFVRQRNQVRD